MARLIRMILMFISYPVEYSTVNKCFIAAAKQCTSTTTALVFS